MIEGQSLLSYAVFILLGGGLFKGISALRESLTSAKERKALSDAIGAKTPAEVESVAVATMASALESAQTRITSLEKERAMDHLYYQERIRELNNQLRNVREEMASMERKLADLLSETTKVVDERRVV